MELDGEMEKNARNIDKIAGVKVIIETSTENLKADTPQEAYFS
jgi:hypothetical protein